MAWDPTLPANSTKIRNAPAVITANNNAIETADTSFRPQALNLLDRTPGIVPIDPVALPISGAVQAAVVSYVKQDAAMNQQIYAIHPNLAAPDNIVQITNFGVGTVDNSVTTNASTFLPGGLIMKYGSVTLPGGANNFADVTFTTAFPNNIYNVQLTGARTATSGQVRIFLDTNLAVTVTSFRVRSDTASAWTVYWTAIGN